MVIINKYFGEEFGRMLDSLLRDEQCENVDISSIKGFLAEAPDIFRQVIEERGGAVALKLD